MVEAVEPLVSAAERHLDREDVEASVGTTTDDLLRQARGLHQSAHGGHGKAYQYFLRGFDAVHGADIAVDLEGVPLNEVSNVHGHGYLDLHFLPRELVTGATLKPGVATADVGDFGVAGSGSLGLGLAESGLHVGMIGSTARTIGASVGYRPDAAGPGTFVWLDGTTSRGIGQSRAWRQARAGAGVQKAVGATELRAFVLGYAGRFESPGVLRQDDVDAGRMGFYDAYPGSGGGLSSRALAAGVAETRSGRWTSTTTVWAQLRALELRQDYTGGWEHPDTGDATLQTQRSASGGARWVARVDLGSAVDVRMGADTRLDTIHQTEAGIDLDGAVWEERIDARVDERALGAWASVPVELGPWRVEPGARVQGFQVQLDRAVDLGLGSGKARAVAPVLAPRLATALEVGPHVTLLGSAGRGFRSPEARGVEDRSAPISVADGGELGAEAHVSDGLELRGGAFGTWVSNEIRFDHAAARFLTTGSTRRLGGFGGFTARPIHALEIELDVTGSDGRYTATGELIPYAPRWLVVGSVALHQAITGPIVWTAGTRTTWLAPRAIPGGFASHASLVTDLTTRARVRDTVVDLDIANVFATRWRDGEFVYASSWNATDLSDPPALPVRHFTAGAPFEARLGLGWVL
ncbi:MAG: TonB-dependent receptor [Alphaproteobacteria bacterium]|nr:TonB-dependent receptor [Alphaproteobacteria bacterium]